MNAYTGFAQVYDELMDNVPYTAWFDFVRDILCTYDIQDGLVLDLCCGTGTFTELLAAAGYDMIGVDGADDMLSVALEKRAQSGHDILYLQQDMREFELYGTVRAIVSICDSMNYLTDPADFAKVLGLVANYLDYGGIFLFDLNTEYKYEELLADHTFAENRENCSFIWENAFDEESRINSYALTLYVKTDETPDEEACYSRFEEYHEQRAYSVAEVEKMLSDAHLELVAVYDGFTKDAPHPESERLIFVTRRPKA
ncbi:MAG: class I SAM-dependent methyltransferase [Lachnospiraceae bacterium]|nr:class I SAM-dependent methyltransferase [Lachnospiraceae bacterium]